MDHKAKVTLLLLLLSGLCNAHTGDHSKKEDISTTIIRMNNGTLVQQLIEGDMLIPKTRNALKCHNKQYSCFWPKSTNGNVEVPFVISPKYDKDERKTILTAMKGFEPKTCIRFVPRTNQRAHLSLEPKFGCFSSLGRVGEKQLVSLQRYGCVEKGIVQHELLHALGFYHEHNRSDRDKYVKIHWDNMPDIVKVNFKKMDTDNLNTKYDYSSVMQYGKTAFGTDGKETITPIPDPNVPIGQRVGMSDIDILRVNRLYNCSKYKQ
ncbi:low choriolytic enzyme [Nematolebias whitei]|uniref:low choriolytic enzyme n=1 Tax=Nematolebias whitei TaxID=451745 RepID=UPI0018976CB8|nr:low choriolytic enzyme [Nematolebias whitei]